ncbi:unnamed protein product [marine sediment metagenome]|uniref:Uncharacterized protein n=1 Tax=marine sediment metagenome TaxID=412755 RepID=X1J744_9ZZZZ
METILHQFKGFHGYDSECFIHIDDSDPGEILICFEDIGKGTPVTNFSEQLATKIIALKGWDPGKCRFFEYYGKRPEEADRIEYKWDGRVASEPEWKPIKPLESTNLFWNPHGRIFRS